MKAYIITLENAVGKFNKDYPKMEQENNKLRDQIRKLRYSIKNIAELL